jgi:hypothetical protein
MFYRVIISACRNTGLIVVRATSLQSEARIIYTKAVLSEGYAMYYLARRKLIFGLLIVTMFPLILIAGQAQATMGEIQIQDDTLDGTPEQAYMDPGVLLLSKLRTTRGEATLQNTSTKSIPIEGFSITVECANQNGSFAGYVDNFGGAGALQPGDEWFVAARCPYSTVAKRTILDVYGDLTASCPCSTPTSGLPLLSSANNNIIINDFRADNFPVAVVGQGQMKLSTNLRTNGGDFVLQNLSTTGVLLNHLYAVTQCVRPGSTSSTTGSQVIRTIDSTGRENRTIVFAGQSLTFQENCPFGLVALSTVVQATWGNPL